MDSELSRLPSNCRRPDLGDRLVRFDELTPADRDELARHAAECAVCGPRSARLERTHAWLNGRSGSLGSCPASDELYDFGQGPGAAPLTAARRNAIDEHVDRCPECKSFVATLATRPPVPLEFTNDDAPAAPAPQPELARVPAQPAPWSRPPRTAWVAAAAAIVIGFGLWVGRGPAGSLAKEELGYPALEAYRSAETSQLAFPRGRVAFDPQTASPLFELTFELMPQAAADGYRIELYRHDGGAFVAGVRVGEVQGVDRHLPAAELGTLQPGHYTWSAWASVGALELPLGERDFELAADTRLDEHWRTTADVEEPNRSFQRLHWLVANGFATDARQLALSLPASPERDEFLARQAER